MWVEVMWGMLFRSFLLAVMQIKYLDQEVEDREVEIVEYGNQLNNPGKATQISTYLSQYYFNSLVSIFLCYIRRKIILIDTELGTNCGVA